MTGIIKWFNNDKGYGFISKPDGNEIFFHLSEINAEDQALISNGITVSFEEAENKKGIYAKNIKYLPSNLLENISEWKLDAKHDEMNRYFFHIEQEKDIRSGKKSFVIGRKGSGKTALSEYISSLIDYNIFTQKLTFKNFPFNNLYELENNDYTRPNQYISLWKYLIYSSICKMMIKNSNIDNDVSNTLAELFGNDNPLSNLKKSIKRWITKDISLNIMGNGGTVSLEHSEQNWLDRIDILEEIIESYIDDSLYFIVFDELDEDYKNIVDLGHQNDYMSLITSLFKAVQDIKSTFNHKNNIRPIVFLRDDIYDLILDSDKNKWDDFRVDLEWNIDRIKNLLAHRISKANDSSRNELSFEDAWSMVFKNEPVGVGTQARKEMPIFEYITRSTHLRPRDYVRYLQASAQSSLDQNSSKIISAETVKKVDKGFSNYLKSELVDEIHGILPDIQEIFGIISEIRKWVFSVDEFKEIYSDRLKKDLLKTKDPDFVLKILFHFSVIGNQPRSGVQFFRYSNKEARFNFRENIVVHRGLFKALQIV